MKWYYWIPVIGVFFCDDGSNSRLVMALFNIYHVLTMLSIGLYVAYYLTISQL